MNLRELFIQWLTASRFIQSLEGRHIEMKEQYEIRLAEKSAQILQLRTEVAALKMRCDRMDTSTRVEYHAAPPQVPSFEGPDDWSAELNRIYREGNNGTHGNGREEVHEQTADDGA